MYVGRMMIIATALMLSGCLAPPAALDSSSHLEKYKGCQLLFPDGSPDPCVDDATRVDAAGGRPGLPWVCIWEAPYFRLFWDPARDEHGFQLALAEDRGVAVTWLHVWTDAQEQTWLAQKEGREFWWRIGNWPGDRLHLAFWATRPTLVTNDSVLEAATLDYLWSARERHPWLNLRFHSDGTDYFFSANRESRLLPGTYSAGSFYLEAPEFTMSFHLPNLASGSVGEMGNPRLPRCV
jgi:hypothetical protein